MTSLMYGGGRLAHSGVHIDVDQDGDTTTDDQSETTTDRLRCGSARKARIFQGTELEEDQQSANDSGSEEDDSLLVAYDSNSQVGSV